MSRRHQTWYRRKTFLKMIPKRLSLMFRIWALKIWRTITATTKGKTTRTSPGFTTTRKSLIDPKQGCPGPILPSTKITMQTHQTQYLISRLLLTYRTKGQRTAYPLSTKLWVTSRRTHSLIRNRWWTKMVSLPSTRLWWTLSSTWTPKATSLTTWSTPN